METTTRGGENSAGPGLSALPDLCSLQYVWSGPLLLVVHNTRVARLINGLLLAMQRLISRMLFPGWHRRLLQVPVPVIDG